MSCDRLVCCAVLAGIWALPVWCLADEPQPTGKTPELLFEQLDRNGDGRLTGDEIPETRRPYFERLLRAADHDKNGELTLREFKAGVQADPPQAAPADDGRGQRPAGPNYDPLPIFRRWDRNGDGRLTLDEIPEPQRERMKSAFDRAGQPDLSIEELARVSERFRTGMGGGGFQPAFFKRLDTNGDGRLSKSEFARAAEIFDELDTNKDGELDLRELFGMPRGPGGNPPRRAPDSPAADKTSDAKPTGPRGEPAATSRPAAPTAAARPAATKQGRASRFDTDGDGRVSRDEATGRIRKNFDRLDANGDGYLERDELQKALRDGRKKKSSDNAPSA